MMTLRHRQHSTVNIADTALIGLWWWCWWALSQSCCCCPCFALTGGASSAVAAFSPSLNCRRRPSNRRSCARGQFPNDEAASSSSFPPGAGSASTASDGKAGAAAAAATLTSGTATTSTSAHHSRRRRRRKRPEGSVEITVPRHHHHAASSASSTSSPTHRGRPYPSPLHTIHVQPLLNETEAARCLSLARSHAAETGCWDAMDTERHASYGTVDFAVEECEALASYLESGDVGFHGKMLGRLSAEYGVDEEDMTYLDFFCANYEGAKDDDTVQRQRQEEEEEEGLRETMDRLALHRDGSLLSFTVLLTPPSEFVGGGTVFDALRDVDVPVDGTTTSSATAASYGGVLHPNGVIRPLRAGDCTLHSGKLLHGADPVLSGTRTVLVGFVDVADWVQRPGVLSGACRDFGRMDVAGYRLRNQVRRTTTSGGRRGRGGGGGANGESDADAAAAAARGWLLRNDRWLPQGERGRGPIVRGYVPAFEAVRRRGDEEFRRRKKLEAEDVLLRDILLGEDERGGGDDDDDDDAASALFGGDVTVL